MSEEVVGDSFKVARQRLQAAFEAAVSDAQSKIENARSEALRKLKP